MSEKKSLHPMEILKEAFQVWGNKVIPVTVFYGVTIFLARSLKWFKPMVDRGQGGLQEWGMVLAFFIAAGFVVAVNAFLALSILRYFQARKGESVSFKDVFGDAGIRFKTYLMALLLLIGFMVISTIVAFIILILGKMFYSSGPAAVAHAIKVAVLVASSTICVILVILAAWYAFFFSLAPLVAAYEKKGPWASMIESRRLVRGNALRFIFVFIPLLLLYIAAGVTVLSVLAHFTKSVRILNLVDPTIAAVMGPLWMAAWFTVYKKVKAIKG